MPRGAFIVFEGADRSGKTTQTVRYTNFLRQSGVPVAKATPWRFPDRTTKIGQVIHSYLTMNSTMDDRTLHLLFSANRWEKASSILESLKAGETVITDRYAYSGVAYSMAKGLPADWCRAADAGLPAPDVVVYFDLSVEAARQRGDYGKERYENEAMQAKVAHAFSKLKSDKWHVVDADADEDTVFSRVLSTINQALDQTPLMETIETLW